MRLHVKIMMKKNTGILFFLIGLFLISGCVRNKTDGYYDILQLKNQKKELIKTRAYFTPINKVKIDEVTTKHLSPYEIYIYILVDKSNFGDIQSININQIYFSLNDTKKLFETELSNNKLWNRNQKENSFYIYIENKTLSWEEIEDLKLILDAKLIMKKNNREVIKQYSKSISFEKKYRELSDNAFTRLLSY